MENCSTRWPRPTTKSRWLRQTLTPGAVEVLARVTEGEGSRPEAVALTARTGLLDRAGPLPASADRTGGPS
ncbi:hypothetical protein QBA54_27620 [Streptomyces sp. B21-108]|jgi:hypothetical protein